MYSPVVLVVRPDPYDLPRTWELTLMAFSLAVR